MADELVQALRTHFGHQAFRPGQAEAIAHLLAGRHTLVVMPTGAGKSLIYQLASLQRTGVTLVLSPLIALMKDQVDSLSRQHIPATCLNSALPGDEQARRLRALAGGAFRLAYVAPERLHSVAFQEALRGLTVDLLAVDEAHCLSQWGHDFRPDYLNIAPARAWLGRPVTAALTATATPQVQDDIVRLLGLPEAERVVTGFNRPNLAFEVRYTADLRAKLQALRELLVDLPEGGAIVYVGTRHEAEEVAEFVGTVAGLQASFYHAGLGGEARSRIQDAFMARTLRLVVATNAFGMGIDRPDVRLVVHYALPSTLEAYYQEAGRAGRDGAPAQAVLLYSPRDRALQEWFIENDAPAAHEVRALFQALHASGRGEVWARIDDLSQTTGLSEVKVKVGLAQLEAGGAAERLGDVGARMLLRLGAWNEAAVQAAAGQVQERRHHRHLQLAQMVAYAESDGCRRRILLDHFGDPAPAEAPRCCDNCLAIPRTAQAGPANDLGSLSQDERAALAILDTLRRLKWETGRRKLAQLLKGSRAKAMALFGYDRSPYFGRLAVLQVREIERLIDQLVRLRYLKVIGGEFPVLHLTPQGEAAIAARARIPLDLPRRVPPEAVAIKRAEREAGGTVALTGLLLARGLAPSEIAARRGLTADTIHTHLARLIGTGELALEAVVPGEVAAQVRSAIAQVGSVAWLAPLKAVLPSEVGYGQIRCVVEAWKREQATLAAEEDAVGAYLARPHPRPLPGPWRAGWALGFHSGFAGEDWGRSPVGELAYRLKYRQDASALPALVEQAAALCAGHPELGAVDAVVPVPPSLERPFDPVRAVAEALAARLGRPVWPALAKVRRTQPQKEMTSLAQKRANVAGAFAVQGTVRGRSLLVVDDLYDSGATLEEVYRVLRAAGSVTVSVLTLTRTIHTD